MESKKNKKVIVFLVVFVIFFGAIFFIIPSAMNANDYVRITKVDYKAELIDNDDDFTKVRVTERITFDIHAASGDNLFWELWRDLPEEWENGQRLVSYKVLSVKRISVDGEPAYLEFEKAPKLYWEDSDYVKTNRELGPNKWFHSEGPYDDYNNFECVLLYVDGLYREQTVFEIEYEIYGAAMRYNDCSELYLPMYSGKNVEYITDFKAEILIPEDKMPKSSYHAWTYGTVAHEIPFTESKTAKTGFTTFSFSLNKSQLKFKPYNRYIEFSLISYGNEKDFFTKNAARTRYYNMDAYQDALKLQEEYENLPKVYRDKKIKALIILIVISLAIPAVIFLIDRGIRKKKGGELKPVLDFEFYREIPAQLDANFAGAFAMCKHTLSDDVPGGYAAAMMGLVRKRYIELVQVSERGDWSPDNTKILLGDKMITKSSLSRKPLTQTEDAYYRLINRHAGSGEITLKELQSRVSLDYEYSDSFGRSVKQSVKSIGVSNGYFKTSDYKKGKKNALSGVIILLILGLIVPLFNFETYQGRYDLVFGGIFILAASLILSAILLLRFSRKYVQLTQNGENEYSKWRGLYNFLNSETLMNERTVPEIEIWEDYLMYATAFGISAKVINALKVKFPEFNVNTSPIIRHPFLCSAILMHSYTRSFRTATRTASVAHRANTYSGGYGGGSGRGGGSGGGGH